MRELGRGGMGVVYEGVDPRTQRKVALKTVGFQGAQVPQRGLERLQREAQALTRLSHPGLVPCLGSGVGPRGYFLAMGLVEGTTLEELLLRTGALPLGRALQLMGDVGEALSYVHAQGLLHRDLKPANVLLSTSGRVVLGDFGLVKLNPELLAASQASLTHSGAMLGTPGYWPPEQAYGRLEQVGTASDVYGWAATLYALLSGEPPRGAKTLAELVSGFDQPIVALSRTRPDVPAWLDRLLERCLATEPEDRPTLHEALDALSGFGRSAAGGPGKTTLKLALTAGLLALALLGGGVLVTLLAEDAPPKAPEVEQTDDDPPPLDPELEPEPEPEPEPERDPQPEPLNPDERHFRVLWKRGEFQAAYEHARAWVAREPDSQLATRMVIRGCVLLRRWDEGLGLATAALERDPEQAQVWGQRADCLLALGRQAEALSAAERAYALEPKGPLILLTYGHALMFDEQLERSAQVYGELIAVKPSALAHTRRASLREQLRDFPGALEDLAAAVELDPNNAEPFVVRGMLKLRQLDDDSGAADLLRALEFGTLQAPEGMLDELIRYYTKVEQPSALLALLDRHFADRSHTAMVRLARIEAFLQLGRGAEALPLSEALLRESAAARYVINHGRVLVMVGRTAEGLDAIERAFQLGPGGGDYYRAAVTYATRAALENESEPQHLERGVRAAQLWVELEPQNVEALVWRLTAWARQGNERVLEEAQRMLPLVRASGDPEWIRPTYLCLADGLARAGRRPEALAALSESLAASATAFGFASRGQLLFELGEFALAERDLQLSIGLESRYAIAWLYLARVWRALGRPQPASFAAQRALALDPEGASADQAREFLEELAAEGN